MRAVLAVGVFYPPFLACSCGAVPSSLIFLRLPALQSIQRKVPGSQRPVLVKKGCEDIEKMVDSISEMGARTKSLAAAVAKVENDNKSLAAENRALWAELQASDMRQGIMVQKMQNLVYALYSAFREALPPGDAQLGLDDIRLRPGALEDVPRRPIITEPRTCRS